MIDKDKFKKVIESELNEQQSQAVKYIDNNSLILAGAWSWKTKSLTYKIFYLKALWTKEKRIFATTFTKAAANEIKERLYELEKRFNIEKNNNILEEDIQFNDNNSWHNSILDDMFDWFEDIIEKKEEVKKKDDNKKKIDFLKSRYPWVGTFHGLFLKILKEEKDIIAEELNISLNESFEIVDKEGSEIKNMRKAVFDMLIKKHKIKEPEFYGDDIIEEINEYLRTLNNFLSTLSSLLKNKWFFYKENNLKGNIKKNILSFNTIIQQTRNEPFIFLMKNIEEKVGLDKFIYQFYYILSEEMIDNQYIDFDDILLLTYKWFLKNKDLAEKYKNYFEYILVDEAQDTNMVQYGLLKLISKNNITLIGDDYQSIYGWRWSDVESFINPEKFLWSSFKIFKIETNYRSTTSIVEMGNNLIKNNENQLEKKLVANNKNMNKTLCYISKTEWIEAEKNVEKMIKLNSVWNSWKDMAVLSRVNDLLRSYELLLTNKNIPYFIQGELWFFKVKEIKDVLSLLKIFSNSNIENNSDMKRIFDILNAKKELFDKLRNISIEKQIKIKKLILNIDDYKKFFDPKEEKKELEKIYNIKKVFNLLINSLKNIKEEKNLDNFLDIIKYKDILYKYEKNRTHNIKKAEEKYKERLQNIKLLFNVIIKNLKKNNNFIEVIKELYNSSLRSAQLQEENDDRITLSTVHKSKWLEYKIVFIIWLTNAVFPNINRLSSITDPKEQKRIFEEERRLMYVAITRAKQFLYLSFSKTYFWKAVSSSPFIEELGSEYIEYLGKK